jgi:hypothetical protein
MTTDVARSPNRSTQPESVRARRGDAFPPDDVDLNSDASFPASDAPSWTPVARIGRPRPAPALGELARQRL